MKQLHKKFTDEQVKSFLKSYWDKKIKRSRFFELLSRYRKDPDNFSIQYGRRTINRKIDPEIEKNMVKELEMEKDLIEHKDIPIKYYYSYIKMEWSAPLPLDTFTEKTRQTPDFEECYAKHFLSQ
jgi:hypothetical protein